MSNFFYILALALLATHELDAVKRHEWRIFPLLNKLPEQLGATIFIVIHIPLFWAVFYLSWHPDQSVRTPVQIGIATFCVIHVALHILLRKHPQNEFANPLSQFLIWGCGAAGATYLGLVFW